MRTKLRAKYYGMIDRCYNIRNKAYKDYGGRGIKVCEEWLEEFSAFKKWAMLNGFNENLQIDRIDNNGNYCPENCRFVTAKTNSNNRRSSKFITFDGKTQTIAQWADDIGIKVNTLGERIRRGWPIEKALTTPVKDVTPISLVGQKFGRLTVLEAVKKEKRKLKNRNAEDRHIHYLCKCDCGNHVIVSGKRLRNGGTRSCGCLHHDIVVEINKNKRKDKGK